MDNLYRALQRAARKLGYNFEVQSFQKSAFPTYVEPEFIALLRKYRAKTMVPWGGLHMAFRAARYIAKSQLPGAVVECGVWRGGCSFIMAEAISQICGPAYDFYMYDTYAGMSEPAEMDASSSGSAIQFFKNARRKKNGAIDWCYASVDEVSSNALETGYPHERFKFVVGKVEDTIPKTVPEKIALLRIDTDWYESTRHELEHLFPRLVSGGVLLCDDYGFWQGSQKAVDEYIADLKETFLLTVDSGTGRAIGMKR